MRMYAHDYIWGVQDRRSDPGPGFGLIDAALWLHRRLRRARLRPGRTEPASSGPTRENGAP